MKTLIHHLRQSALFKLAVKAGLTLLVFWFVFRGIDFNLLKDMLEKQNHSLLAVGALCMLIQMMVGALRWRLILNALSESGSTLLSHLSALKIYYISMFFSCCLPGTVGGDVMRVWITKSEGMPMSITIHSVIIDRIIALTALITMIIFAMPKLGSMAGFNPVLVLVILALLAGIAIVFLLNLEKIIGRYRHVRMVNWVLYFLNSLRLLLKRRQASLKSFVIAIFTHTFYCIGAYFLAQSFHIPISLFQCIILLPPVLLATTIPVSIGGWGIREAGTITMLGLIGVAQEQALMLSIQMGVILIFITLPASILWLLYRKRSSQPMHLHNADIAGRVS